MRPRNGARWSSSPAFRWNERALRANCASALRLYFSASQPLSSSWPGLTRPSTSLPKIESKDVDARHETGHDDLVAIGNLGSRHALAFPRQLPVRVCQKYRAENRKFAALPECPSHCNPSGATAGPCFGNMRGPVAQWLEPAAHNGLVAGSSPAGPTSLRSLSASFS